MSKKLVSTSAFSLLMNECIKLVEVTSKDNPDKASIKVHGMGVHVGERLAEVLYDSFSRCVLFFL